MRNESFFWQTSDHHDEPRTRDWYWAVAIIAIALSTTAFILGAFVFGVFIIVATFALISLNFRPAKVVEVEINDREIKVDDKAYLYTNIQSFWIDMDGNRNKLLVKTIKPNHIELVLDIEDQDPSALRAYLSRRIEEEKMAEPLSHVLLEKLGF